MKSTPPNDVSLRQFLRHPRDWRENLYVYPVISRRSRGLSIGVNLNPDAACNFDCVYCQVDRTVPPRVRDVDPERLRDELSQMIDAAITGSLFEDEAFADVPASHRRINDIAFSGDGEPTTCKLFGECVRIAADLKRQSGLDGVKIVLITDACYLTRPDVEAGLAVMDKNNGEIWAKLDAGTEEYYRLVNRPNYPLRHVMDNIIAAARIRPVVIQSLFMRLHGESPPDSEILAFTDRLNEVVAAGGRINLVQVYTVSRRPAEAFVAPLTNDEVDCIVQRVRDRTALPTEAFYGSTAS
jgi:wyosine [tRNA(Phe)-imidazoG37] synthetase (radical SAM superfamily)